MALLNRCCRGCGPLELRQVGRSITRALSVDRTLLCSSSPQNPDQETYVEIDQTNGVRRIKLNHPKTRNSLSLNMMSAILESLTKDLDDPNLRSIVISAAPGKIFSAGHNLKELSAKEKEQHHRSVFVKCWELVREISHGPVPVIAAVDGLAAAAGCQLVAACDIAVCTERSSFSTPGVNFGIFCSTPGIPLIRNVPKKVAAHMLFTGLPISAHEAYNAGLVSKVVPNDKLDSEIEIITEAIDNKSRSIIHLGKEFFREQIEMDIETAYTVGTEVMINNLKLKDAQEGLSSFIEKRKPTWNHSQELF